MSYIRSGDAALYYEEYGSGPPLILLPGLLGTLETHWRRFVPDLAREFHVVLTDLRGHGRTDNPGGTLTVSRLAEDLAVLTDTLELRRPCIAGYSLGGYVGLLHTLRPGSDVRSLAAHAMKWFWTPEDAEMVASALDPEAPGRGIPARMERLRADHAPGNGEDGWRHLLAAAAELVRSLPGARPPDGVLAGMRSRVLLTTCATDSFVTPEETAALAALIPGSATSFLDTCKHPMESLPRQPFAGMLAAFFRGEDSAAGQSDTGARSP